MSDVMTVEVAYAGPEGQWIVALLVPQATTVEEAVKQSGLLRRIPDFVLSDHCVGVFSKPVSMSTTLVQGDRVELYRGLIADPKVVRRKRAQQQKKSR
jgi:putative ubiquitin-RnfH superfamily antitoxin RatB of RatAB toxin-antitoxin module